MKKLIASVILISVVISCGKGGKEEKVQTTNLAPKPLTSLEGGSQSKVHHPQMTGERVIKIEKPVKVPKEVEKTWKTAIIDIVDRSSKKVLKEFTVHKGSKVKFKNYEISVLYIVPHLVIDQGFTSASNEPLNPGILVEVKKEGKLIYKGPIYQKFPEMYNLAVKDIMIILKEIKKSKG
jgi:hypothetical protein